MPRSIDRELWEGAAESAVEHGSKDAGAFRCSHVWLPASLLAALLLAGGMLALHRASAVAASDPKASTTTPSGAALTRAAAAEARISATDTGDKSPLKDQAMNRTTPVSVENKNVTAENSTTNKPEGRKTMDAYFAAGCFWGVENVFRAAPGVVATAVGYSGGETENPNYKLVCTDATGHAETVHIEFDPQKTSYEDLVRLFFTLHDPTQVNRQGPDFGTQYRSAVFFTNEGQKTIAEKVKSELDKSGKYHRPIATQIVPFSKFWMAEDYHQQYYEKRGIVGGCAIH